MALNMTHEQKLIGGLTLLISVILLLIAGLTLALNWGWLAIATLLFVLSYPLIWLAYRLYQFWRLSVMSLTSYCQMLQQGEHNARLLQQNPNNLLADLQLAISELGANNQSKIQQQKSIESLLTNILDSWPVPICLFDHQLQLSYRNRAMNEYIQQPMLRGTKASDLGFSLEQQRFTHPLFDQQWQTQTISYQHDNQPQWLFSALDISSPLNQTQSITQQNLIRVLTHELRNSLTPMASMADTLLSSDSFNENQVKLVLERILKRSNGLLTFIGSYAQLAKLPKPQAQWFDFNELIGEAQGMIDPQAKVTVQGESQCFADRQQLSQVFINLFKNAEQACKQTPLELTLKHYLNSQQQQIIELSDNGPGFANLNNALTPFYTTKANGSGIGLTLCAEIIKNHGGQIHLANIKEQDLLTGAQITIQLPSP